MFEGKEVVGKIGEYGDYGLDLTPDGHVEASVVLKVDLLAEIEKVALKTNTKLDDYVVSYLKMLLGRK